MEEKEDRIRNILLKYQVVGIDTTPFIYHFEADKKYTSFTQVLFGLIEDGKLRGVTSTVTLMEILVKPKQEENEETAEDYKFVLQTFPNLKIKTIDHLEAEKAAELRAKYGIRPPDALQLGASLNEGAQAFITNDEKLKQVKEINVIVMKDVLGL